MNMTEKNIKVGELGTLGSLKNLERLFRKQPKHLLKDLVAAQQSTSSIEVIDQKSLNSHKLY